MSNNRRRMSGVVTRAKMQKTVTVQVDRSYRHPLYGKVVHARKMFLAHDELGCRPGDLVQILESRPISARKRWVVETILRRASEEQLVAASVVEAGLPDLEPAEAAVATAEGDA
ncbi:MAG: 30S ribosomal protein S17 [Anaerolineales bacterium]|nr:30S ribosomal protein S17 [Anaerolineales bacterium]